MTSMRMTEIAAMVFALGAFGCGSGSEEPAANPGSGGSAGSPSGAGAGGSTDGGTGNGGTSGSAGTGGSGASGAGGASGGNAGASSGGNAGSGGTGGEPSSEPFSFFVTSLKAMQELSGSQSGFGGDLTYGESGPGAGLRGADKICTEIAEKSMPGNHKVWRAFLSATAGEDGEPVFAIDRIGEGPWYDRVGRIVANTREDLQNTRPNGAHADIVDDLPNEDGVPNHQPDPNAEEVDNHDILTGADEVGELYSTEPGFTCNDWTSAVGSTGTPRVGHSWPRSGGPGGPGGGGGEFSGESWTSALNEAGCAPGVNLIEMGPPNPDDPTVGSGGGYGGIYCFALSP
jgi:hypothetical protein